MQTSLLVLFGGLIGNLFGAIFSLLYLGFIVAIFVGLWKMFEKAGKPGWASLIPIYNFIVLHEIIGRETWKIVLLFIPFVNFYFIITLIVSLAKSFGKRETGDYILAIFFYPFTLGLSSAQYVGPSEGPNAVAAGRVQSNPSY